MMTPPHWDIRQRAAECFRVLAVAADPSEARASMGDWR
jgi:hypothetical protein